MSAASSHHVRGDALGARAISGGGDDAQLVERALSGGVLFGGLRLGEGGVRLDLLVELGVERGEQRRAASEPELVVTLINSATLGMAVCASRRSGKRRTWFLLANRVRRPYLLKTLI